MKANGSPKLLRLFASRTLPLIRPHTRLFHTSRPAQCPASESPHAPLTQDHRQIGAWLDFFSVSTYSPGNPILHPDGAHVFLQLQTFLRAQHAAHGFREVVTPNIYKRALWQRSGHWQNYRDDMFAVRGGKAGGRDAAAVEPGLRAEVAEAEEDGDEDWGLKPMNCPAHCLIFAARLRSYRELPLRFADFGALHRDEVRGALSGLKRARRFHQDDGHVFCTPQQVGAEIARELGLVKLVYEGLGMQPYRLVLGTRPKGMSGAPGSEGDNSLGSAADWDDAEQQLRQVLEESGQPWSVAEGEGAFYGPKIDIVVQDARGREHQTATVQLDFQLPKRFELRYAAPSPERVRGGPEDEVEASQLHTPVLIHRAVLGSLERFLALLLEKYNGVLPFWLNPRQLVVVSTHPDMDDAARTAAAQLAGTDPHGRQALQPLRAASRGAAGQFCVTTDLRKGMLNLKIREAATKKASLVGVVGQREADAGTVSVRWQAMRPERREEARAKARELGMEEDGSIDVKQLGKLMNWMVEQYI